jgi:hypothetical protein
MVKALPMPVRLRRSAVGAAIALSACGARTGLDVLGNQGGPFARDVSIGGDASDADAGTIAPPANSFCVTAPWINTPATFEAQDGATAIPPGEYTLRYVGGAQIHDPSEGYEVTAHYVASDGTLAGHHLFNGPTPETSPTSAWLDDTGTVGRQPTVADVERLNAGHTWPLQHGGGPLGITYYDDYYGDNQGPGTRLCLDVPVCAAGQSVRPAVSCTVP